VDAVCQRLVAGRTLQQISRLPDIPQWDTLLCWQRRDHGLKARIFSPPKPTACILLGGVRTLVFRTILAKSGDLMSEAAPRRRAAFGFIFASTIASTSAIMLIGPVLPNMVRELNGGDAARAAEWMMLFASGFGLAQFLCAPVLGMLSDRYGRRPVLLIANLGLSIDFLFMAVAPTMGWLVVGRIVGGMTAATFAAANAYVADVTPPEKRAAAFGWMSSALAFGFLLGPAIGGALGEVDTRLPFLAAAALTLANVVYGALVLPESLPPERRTPRLDWRRANPHGSLRLLRQHGELLPLALVGLFAAFSNMIWGTVWVLFCAHRFGWGSGAMGLQIMAAGVLGLAVQARLIGPIVARIGERRALLVGAGANMLALVWAGASPSGFVFVLSMPFAAFGVLLTPALESLLSRQVGTEMQGRVQGATKSLNALAVVFGPAIYGTVFAWSLRQESGFDLSGLAVFVSAAFMGGCMLLALRSRPARALT
jgi:DHA1 family tetracycline resistance protein-like MFS transporter